MTVRRRWQIVVLSLAILAGSTQLRGQGGPFTAQIEAFWRLISTGGRTFQTLVATNATIGTLTLTSTSVGTLSVTGQLRCANGTVGAPCYSFTNVPNAGFYEASSAGSGDLRMSIGGADAFRYSNNPGIGFQIPVNLPLAWGLPTTNTTLFGPANDTLEQRRGTNAQTFNLYSTFTDTSNFERLQILAQTAGDYVIQPGNLGTGSLRALALGGSSGVQQIRLSSTQTDFNNSAGNSTFWRINSSAVLLGLNAASKIGQYASVNTAGWGVPAIYASGRALAQTGANASVATYTVGAADGSFEVSADLLATTATTFSFVVNCTYTDESNTARTISLPFRIAGDVNTGSVSNTNGAIYAGIPIHIRAKAATVITVLTAGTFTTVTYNVEGIIKQMS